MVKHMLLIGLGGFTGSILRYLVSRLNNTVDWLAVPLGTLMVNVLGSFLIGFFIGISERSPILNVELRMFLMVGLCGGFTTFSTFTGENLALMRSGQFLPLFLYTGLSILLGFAAVWIGYISTRLLN
jgi:CrcB protein